MEATGYSRWFERLLAELGFEVWIGGIHASNRAGVGIHKGVLTMSVINTNQLKSALERLCLVVPKRATLPVLENL
jgi:hypothetical protein